MRNKQQESIWMYVAAIALAIAMLMTILKFADQIDGIKKVVYDCSLSEISPDFPPEVRNECRKLRSKQ